MHHAGFQTVIAIDIVAVHVHPPALVVLQAEIHYAVFGGLPDR